MISASIPLSLEPEGGTSYWLVPTPGSIHINGEGVSSSPTLTVAAFRKSGDSPVEEVTDAHIKRQVIKTTGAGTRIAFGGSLNTSSPGAGITGLEFQWRDDADRVLAQCSVPIIRDGKPGADGTNTDGKPGATIRKVIWEKCEDGFQFQNGDGTTFLDYCVTPHGGLAMCMKTHVKGSGGPYADYDAAQNDNAWQPTSVDPFAVYILSLAVDAAGNTWAGLTGMSNTVFWAGGDTPETARLNIDRDGNLNASNCNITGIVNATEGHFGNLKIEDGGIAVVDKSNKTVMRFSMGEVPNVDNVLPERYLSDFENRVSAAMQNGGPCSIRYNKTAGLSFSVNGSDSASGSLTLTGSALTVKVPFTLPNKCKKVTFKKAGCSAGTGLSPTFSVVLRKKNSTGVIDQITATGDFTVSDLAAGDYELTMRVTASSQSGLTYVGLGITLDGIYVYEDTTAVTIEPQFIFAKNGFLSYGDKTRYMRYSKDEGFDVRFGNYILQVGTSGIRGSSDGGSTFKILV